MLLDLHVHCDLSARGKLPVSDILDVAAERGLDGVCLTSQNSLIDDFQPFKEMGAARNLTVLIGAEVITDNGLLLCFFPDVAETPPLGNWLLNADGSAPPAQEAIDQINESGGVAVAATPFSRDIPPFMGDRITGLNGLAAVEVFCARVNRNANDLALRAAERLNLPGIGGSGVHDDLELVGKAATLFKDKVSSEADLVYAIRSGEVWGVLIGAQPGGGQPNRKRNQQGRGGGRQWRSQGGGQRRPRPRMD
ncbi:MAG: hypothetical protein GMKNLPBB_01865 [Myxococcota bacterium]|nr:hypothetical protein [Myxococcota bacterium]